MIYTFDRWRTSDAGDPAPGQYHSKKSDFHKDRANKSAIDKSNVKRSAMLLSHVRDVSAVRPFQSEELSFFYKTGTDARPEEWPSPGTYTVDNDTFAKRVAKHSKLRPSTSRSVFGDASRFKNPADVTACNFLVGPGSYKEKDWGFAATDSIRRNRTKTTFTKQPRLHPVERDLRKSFPGPGTYKSDVTSMNSGATRFQKFVRATTSHRERRSPKANVRDSDADALMTQNRESYKTDTFRREFKFWTALERSKFGSTRGTYTPGPAAHAVKRPTTTHARRPATTFGTFRRPNMVECLRQSGQLLAQSPGPTTAVGRDMLKLSISDRIRQCGTRAGRRRAKTSPLPKTVSTTKLDRPVRSPTRSGDDSLRRPSLRSFRSWNIGKSEALVDEKRRRRRFLCPTKGAGRGDRRKRPEGRAGE